MRRQRRLSKAEREVLAQWSKQVSSKYGFSLQRTKRMMSRMAEIDYSDVFGVKDSWVNPDYIGLCVDQAAEALPKSKVYKLLEAPNADRVLVRFLAARGLHEPGTALYSLDELADLIRNFCDLMEEGKEEIIKTGHPAFAFTCHNVLDPLARHYYTRVPKAVVHDSKEVAADNASVWEFPCGPSGIDILIDLSALDSWPTGTRFKHKWPKGRYENGVILSGLSDEEVSQLEGARDILFDLKMELLRAAEEALRRQDPEFLWTRFTEEVYERIPEKDMRFYFDVEKRYGNGLEPSRKYENAVKPKYTAGGIKALIYFVQFCMMEISLGLYQKTREALSDFIDEETHAIRRFHISNYFDLMEAPTRDLLDTSLDGFVELSRQRIDELKRLCDRFGKFMVKEAKREGTLRIPTKGKYLDEFGPDFKSLADFYWTRLDKTGEPPKFDLISSSNGARSAEQPIQRFPTPPGTQWKDVRMEFVSKESVKIRVGSTCREYHLSQMGLAHGKHPLVPSKSGKILMFLARYHNLSTESGVSSSDISKSDISKFRTRLREFFGRKKIKGDPIPWTKLPDSKKKGYVPEFLLTTARPDIFDE